jgi:hypothetical protein
MPSSPLTFAELKRAIIESCTPDLLEKKYREQLSPSDPRETGHCAVASEAFYHLAGGKKAGFIPVVCGYAEDNKGNMKFKADIQPALQAGWKKQTHWWIRGPEGAARGGGKIFDITSGQYDAPYPYQNGHNTGFMQPQQKPSKRAQIVIDRVAEKIGAARLEAYKQANLKAYAQAGECLPTHKSHRAARSPRT